jgi:extracellular factor (EF) 3-hydroxypalmitic acid methyl ester biosynthesis protein
MMHHSIEYLSALVEQGGPLPEDYPQLNKCIDDIAIKRRSGLILMGDMKKVIEVLGEAMTPTTMQGFAYHKPHGYAGDFEIIDRIYQRYICPNEALHRWDNFWQNHAAAQAVRNRTAYLISLVFKSIIEKRRPIRVLNLASGPSRDVYECCRLIDGVTFDCVEQDTNAIAYAKAICTHYSARVRFHHANAIRYHPRQQYDLIWSSGLFDYFNNKLFSRVVRRYWKYLTPEGEFVVGNFSTENPSRSYMELFEWDLFHRSQDELRVLGEEAGIPPEAIRIRWEPLGVNLFLHMDHHP